MPDTALLETARALRPRVMMERDRIEASRRLPEDITRELARAGFFRIFVPRVYGGLDLSPMEALEVFEELARADASVAWCVWNGNTHWTTARWPSEVARMVHADPDVIIANSTRASGQARVVDGGYQVTGRWSLVSGCELSAWMTLLCVVHDSGGPGFTPAGAPGSRFVLVPSPACEIIDTWTTGGLRGTGSHDIAVRDLFVPGNHSSSFTDPFVLSDPRYRLPPFSRVIPGLGAMALGIARNAIDTLTEMAAGKQLQRSGQTLRESHDAQVRMSRAESLVRSARLFLFDSVERFWTAVIAGGEVTMEARASVRLAASHAVASAVEAVDLLYIAGGASSLYASCPLERAFRDVHAITQHIGVHPRVMETTGRVLFGLAPDTPLL
jgi:alkylation response protein AidB-like acyl-CoA dehydrogenase